MTAEFHTQGVFLIDPPPENFSRLPPPLPSKKKATPKSSKYDKIHSDPQTLRLFSIMGGASLGLSSFFEIGYLPANT